MSLTFFSTANLSEFQKSYMNEQRERERERERGRDGDCAMKLSCGYIIIKVKEWKRAYLSVN